MDQQETYELIEAYLQDNLGPQDAHQFEERLKSDSEFAHEFELHQQLHQEFSPSRLNEFRNLLQEEASTKSQARIKTLRLGRALSIAASVALIVTAGFLYFSNQANSTGDLYATYMDHPALPFDGGVERGDENNGLEELIDQMQRANILYEDKQYGQAMDALKIINSGIYKDHEDAINLRLGMYSLLNDEAETAIGYFDKIQDASESAMWYKGLAYLKLGNKEKVRELLDPLTSFQNPKQEDAKEILKSLE